MGDFLCMEAVFLIIFAASNFKTLKMMKKMLIMMTSLMLALPIMAQYGRPSRMNSSRYGHYHQPPRQYRHTDVYYGLRIGGSFSTVSSDDPYLDGGSLRAGLNVGAVIGWQVAPQTPVYFEAGLSYVEKGGEGHNNGAKFTYDLDYLEVPLVLKYNGMTRSGVRIQPFVGGYLALGVGGKIKDFGNRHAYSSFDDVGFKRFDGGVKVGCGLQYDYLYAEVGYDFGLSNISHDYFDTSHTGALFATIGVNF